MTNPKRYKSLSFNSFNLIRFVLFGSLPLFVAFTSVIEKLSTAGWATALTILSLSAIYMATSYSEISSHQNKVTIKDLSTTITISPLKSYKTWWSYDFTRSSSGVGDAGMGKRIKVANKINCFVKFESEDEVGFIYEQIYLSDKFPNNHPYSSREEIDETKLVKVWDIDKCLSKLDLNKELKTID